MAKAVVVSPIDGTSLYDAAWRLPPGRMAWPPWQWRLWGDIGPAANGARYVTFRNSFVLGEQGGLRRNYQRHALRATDGSPVGALDHAASH